MHGAAGGDDGAADVSEATHVVDGQIAQHSRLRLVPSVRLYDRALHQAAVGQQGTFGPAGGSGGVDQDRGVAALNNTFRLVQCICGDCIPCLKKCPPRVARSDDRPAQINTVTERFKSFSVVVG